jgi:hypothetical protein
MVISEDRFIGVFLFLITIIVSIMMVISENEYVSVNRLFGIDGIV